MKKRIFLLCVVLTFLLLLCSGCKEEYQFLQERNNINFIEIVSFKYGGINSDWPEEQVICRVENVDGFLSDFLTIEYEYVHPPQNPEPTPTVIKFAYSDGTYEAVCPYGKFISQHGTLNFHGSGHLNETQFYNLIERYLGSPSVPVQYGFFDKEAEISTIEIVYLGDSNHANLPEIQNIICQIEDHAVFLKKFSEVNCFISVTPPTTVSNNTKAIKITYSGGHYELIDAFGQTRSTGKSYTGAGYRYFDNSQFSNLIESFINK